MAAADKSVNQLSMSTNPKIRTRSLDFCSANGFLVARLVQLLPPGFEVKQRQHAVGHVLAFRVVDRVDVVEYVLHAEVRIHQLQPPVRLFRGLHLADQGRVRAAIPRPPLLERRAAHAMRPAQFGLWHPSFGLPLDRKDLTVSVSACLH